MPVRPLSIVLRSVSTAVMLWGYSRLSTLVNHHIVSAQVGGHFQHLTIQGLAAACLTTVLGLTADLLPSTTGFRKVQRASLMISLPVSLVVSSIYWSLLLLSPSLILPPALNAEPSSSSAAPTLMWIPPKLDFALHASPALSSLADFFAYHEPYTLKEVNYSGTFMIILAGAWYASWAEYCGSYNKIFPYPFLTKNPLNVRIWIYAGATLLGIIAFRIINFMHPRRNIKVMRK